MALSSRKTKLVFGLVVTFLIFSAAVLSYYNLHRAPDPPEILPGSGTYTRERKIVMNKPKGTSVTIYYTLDGSDPKTSSSTMVYTNPFIITGDTTVKAYTKDEHNRESKTIEQTYVITIGG
jgi:hypothetical protein